jgi:hypothetical protein
MPDLPPGSLSLLKRAMRRRVMKDRQTDTVLEKMVDQALVFAVQMAIESVPIVGPVFVALSIVSDIQKVKKRLIH